MKRWRKKKAIIEGPTSILDPVKDALLSWVFQLRERGHAVDRSMVVMKACMLFPAIMTKSDNTLYKVAELFLDCCSLVYPMGTKESQRPPNEVSAEALDFIKYACATVAGRDKSSL